MDKPLVWDHDHATGDFRGWLCANCNSGIGLLGDRSAGVLSAAVYLARVEEKAAARSVLVRAVG